MSEQWFYDYLNGKCSDCYRYFGAHPVKGANGEKKGYVFRVYAPLAQKVELIGDFNGWLAGKNPMKRVDPLGLWEVSVPMAECGQRYKYHLQGQDGFWRDKADPVGFLMEKAPGSCSLVYDLGGYEFHDQDWMSQRDRNFDKAMSIYEMHIGSWRGKEGNYLVRYEDLADALIKYCHDMGYTHVEFMPLTSYPYDGSWGYQATGYFAADSRYGVPKGLMQLVDELHQANIGVILDMVPVHFALDPYGLEKFDGSNVYEYSGDMEYSQWGSKNFDLGKDPVRSFLISSADFFLSLFHFDGIRIDAVSNIIFTQGDPSRGKNLGGIEFARRLNDTVHQRHPTVMTIAEDSTAFTDVTKGFKPDGLHFDYKWDLGWMNDTLKYYGKDPVYKKFAHNQITFSMMYYYSENFLLPLSHDEVVHGKGTILNKMWGNYDQKFALIRNLYSYMFAHPGKKLNFMGNEFGTIEEWDEKKGLQWDLLNYPKHSGLQRLTRDLNRIYCYHPAMHLGEYDPYSFQWIMADDAAQSVLVFRRSAGNETMVFVFNMTPNFYSYYDIGVPFDGEWAEIFNSDKAIYGGLNQFNGIPLKATNNPLQGQPFRITIRLAPFGALFLTHVDANNRDTKEIKENTTAKPAEETVEVNLNKDVKIITNKNRSMS